MALLLIFGFFLGVRHALEPDHVVAVLSLATRTSSLRQRVGVAALWGAGHAGTLFLFGSIIIALEMVIPAGLSRFLEGAVGLMLIALGFDVLRRAWRKRVHFHTHEHGDGQRHFHAHAHPGEAIHNPDHHEHEHPGRLSQAVLVGSLHGLAGSAPLVLLSLETMHSAAQALLYVALVGVGSIVGMALFSLAISLPLRLSGSQMSGAFRSLEAALGAITLALGFWIVLQAVLPGTLFS